MDNESILDKNDDTSNYIDNEGVAQLREIRKWTMFLSILGFIFIGFLFISMIITLGMGTAFAGNSTGSLPILFMIIMLAVYFFPIYYLYKFSTLSKEALSSKGVYSFTDALIYLKKHYKFVGIMTIVVLSFYLLFAIGFGIASTNSFF